MANELANATETSWLTARPCRYGTGGRTMESNPVWKEAQQQVRVHLLTREPRRARLRFTPVAQPENQLSIG